MNYLTSCSDNGQYPQFCYEAATKDSVYKAFRQNPVYTSIVETVSQQDGKNYLRMALDQSPELKKYLKYFSSSEKIGSPKTIEYKIGLFSQKYQFSPTTLRYIKVLSDLIQLFGDLNGMNIIEIGGGYGGLCKILFDFCQVGSYSLVDLEPCLALSKRFLNDFNINNNVNYITPLDVPHLNKSYNLAISNYAFSEVKKDLQELYLSKILENSKKGYLLCNFKSHTWQLDQMSAKDFEAKFQNLRSFKDDPILSPLDINCGIELITWQ